MNEEKEHRKRLKLLEENIGKYYYMIGNIHNDISNAMESYAQQRVNEVLDKADKEIHKEWKKHSTTPNQYDIGIADGLDLAGQITDKLKSNEK